MTDPDRKLLLEWIDFSIEMGERIGDLTQAIDKHLRGEDVFPGTGIMGVVAAQGRLALSVAALEGKHPEEPSHAH